jgi:hypothetical protein
METKIFKNIGDFIINTKPTAPSNLEQTIKNNTTTLKWGKASDAQTSQDGLSYNIRVGSSSGSSNIVNPMSSTFNGYRRIPAIGNAGQNINSYTLNLPAGTYYWSVQAIDNTFTGGDWADENSFTVTSTQASDIVVDNLSIDSMRIKWTNESGKNCVVFIAEGNKGMAKPINNITYTANKIVGLGTKIDTTGWFCVYNGSQNEVTITGYKELTLYSLAVIEYIGNEGYENYNLSITKGNPITLISKGIFEEQASIYLIGLQASSADWGDYNNDGFLDILLTGSPDGKSNTSKIYKNNGNGTFTEQIDISLIGICGTAAWGDFNNDGFLDILIVGNHGTFGSINPVSKIYKNNGDGTFIEKTGISLPAVAISSVAWGDYNNDGFLDILFTGVRNMEHYSTIIYKNNGDETFTEQISIQLIGLKSSSAAWGDFNNDGLLDFRLTGITDSDPQYRVFLIYKNNGDGTFIEQDKHYYDSESRCESRKVIYLATNNLFLLVCELCLLVVDSSFYENYFCILFNGL